MAALSSFIVTCNDWYAHDCKDGAPVTKMASPLNTCTAIEQRGVVQILWAEGMAAKDIHKQMLPMYGEHCLSRLAVHNRVQKFSEGGQYRRRTSSRSAGGDRHAGNVEARRRHHPSRQEGHHRSCSYRYWLFTSPYKFKHLSHHFTSPWKPAA